MGRAIAVVDEKGRVMAAQFGAPSREDGDADQETPASELRPLPGHQLVEMEVPDELEQLSGEEMARFFSHVKVSWPADVRVPKVEVVRGGHDSAGA